MSDTVLVTGGAGFIGSNLAYDLAGRGKRVVVFDNLDRKGTKRNLEWLKKSRGGAIRFIRGDVRDTKLVTEAAAGCRVIYHLAAQVAVTTSVADPRKDFQVNALGAFNVLEAARLSRQKPIVLLTSTNKVYGGMEDLAVREGKTRYFFAGAKKGVSESRPLDFHSPYGCSKGAADQYFRDYSRIYGVPTVVFRMSCIYGPRQFGNEDQGWVAHFLISGMTGKPLTVYGNGKQVRDILYVSDLVAAFHAAVRNIDKARGQVFNIGGGPSNTLALIELLEIMRDKYGYKVKPAFADWRPGDQPLYVSDIRKARKVLGWKPALSRNQGLDRLHEWIEQNKKLF